MLIAELTFKINRKADISIDQQKQFEKQLGKNMHKLGDMVLDAAQRLVPYDTGNLHSSARLEYLSDGFRITYDTIYAYPLHEGESIDEAMTGINYVASTRKHRRRLASGKIVKVRKHNKTYKTGYKPVASMMYGKESWKAIDVTKEYTAQPWLRRAWEIVVSRLTNEEQRMVKDHLVIERGEFGYEYERF
tara:strand:+ start:63 stop:632 length:570 start_codon:yes stop_codon:yes gene_type:complete